MNADIVLQDTELKIFSIGACYGSGLNNSDWSLQHDYEARRVQDIFNIINDY